MSSSPGFRCSPQRVESVTVLVVLAFLLAFPVSAQQPEKSEINLAGSETIDTSGNAQVHWVMTFNPPRGYDRVKRNYPNLYVLFRDFGPERSSFEINRDTLRISSDDGQRSISFNADVWGLAVSRSNRWQLELQPNEQVSAQESNHVITVLHTGQGGVQLTTINTYVLPQSARAVQIDNQNHLLTYMLPEIKNSPNQGAREPEVAVSVRYKERLMAAVYKVYGDSEAQSGTYWAAKTIFKNAGRIPIYNLKIYYKLGQFTEMSVPDAYSVVPSGGAVVDRYYPIIHSQVVQLRTATPLELYIRYEYKDAAGRPYSSELTRHVQMLGINQFEFSNLNEEDRSDTWSDYFNNAPLLSAFVTKVDEAVKQLAGYISEASGGAAAAGSKEGAVRWLKAAYLMELGNNIVYQTPSGFLTKDHSSGQEIKFPRDVLRDKSGTCIDLAITYAALAESVGLHSILMVVPGHTFPVIQLPNGELLPVESTGLGGGSQRMTFEQAVETGLKEWQKYRDEGIFYLVDVEKEWTEGRVPNPELQALGVDFLEKSGIKRISELAADAGAAQQPSRRGSQLAGQQMPAVAGQSFRVVHDHGLGLLAAYCIGTLVVTPDSLLFQAESANDGRMDHFEIKKSDIIEAKKNRLPLGQNQQRFEAFHIRLRNGVNLNFAQLNAYNRGLSADPVLMALTQ
jgi:hypothetical protein